MTSRLVRFVAVSSTLLLAAVGCSDGGSAPSATDESTPDTGDGSAEPSDRDTSDPDSLVTGIVDDLNEYWSMVDDELGFSYTPVPADRVSDGSDGALCDGAEIDPEEVAENAFVDGECSEGLLVAYDPDYLEASVPRAESTLAHEWGHVVQAQAAELDISASPDGLPIDAELQADCFAGAWTAGSAVSDADAIRRDVAESGDPDDVGIDDPDAHGFPEERTTAFDVGFEAGPTACVDELLDALPG